MESNSCTVFNVAATGHIIFNYLLGTVLVTVPIRKTADRTESYFAKNRSRKQNLTS